MARVSTVKSYGSQYREFLQESSPDELLERMRKKIEEAKKKDAAGAEKKPGKQPEPKGDTEATEEKG